MNTSITNITLNNKNFQLLCKPEEEAELHMLVKNLNARLSKIKISNPTASFELLLIMVALSLQEEVFHIQDNINYNPENRADALSEANDLLGTVISSLENLANKLRK